MVEFSSKGEWELRGSGTVTNEVHAVAVIAS